MLQKPLLALSGGIDSMVLCKLFLEAGISFDAAHVQFHLRGEESIEDQRFVEDFCAQQHIRLHVTQFDTKHEALICKKSIEETARILRYRWFQELVDSFAYSAVCTAHHANDLTETIIWNLMRGTGLEGLKGIPKIHGKIIRPLLFASRADIEHYALQHSISFRVDSTNTDTTYTRNFIRARIVPAMEEVKPDIVQQCLTFSQRMLESNELLMHFIQSNPIVYQTNNLNEWRIEKSTIVNATHLYLSLKDFQFSSVTAQAVFESMQSQTGKRFESPTHILITDRDAIIIRPHDYALENVNLTGDSIPFTFQFGQTKYILFETVINPKTIKHESGCWYLNRAFFNRKWTIRAPKIGEKIRVFGMKNGRKKISDILIDAKLNYFQKESVFIIENEAGKIAGCFPVMISEDARVTEETCICLTQITH